MKKKHLQQIKSVLKHNLLSCYQYSRYKDEIVILIIDKISFRELENIRSILVKYPFIIFKKTDIKNGNDVFPVDFLSIKIHSTLLCGKNVFANICSNKRHIRHQLEYELRNKLIYLREQFVLTRNLKILLFNILPTLYPFIEAMLYIKGEKSSSIIINLKKLKKTFKLDTAVLIELNKIENKKKRLDKKRLLIYFNKLNTLLEKWTKVINNL